MIDKILAPVALDLPAFVTLSFAASMGGVCAATEDLLCRIDEALPGHAYAAVVSMIEAGKLASDLCGTKSALHLTPAGRRALAAGAALLKGHERTIAAITGEPLPRIALLLEEQRRSVFRNGRPTLESAAA